MPDKPTTAAGYAPDQIARVRATCLYLATKLGDLMPELVVVGGLVPSLLIDQQNLPENVTPHVGTLDLDLGLAFALVGEQRYQAVAERLRTAGFEMDRNEEGHPTRQRWRISDPPVKVDFLIEPNNPAGMPGRLFPLTKDWAAIIAPGLHLAFQNSSLVLLEGKTILGETAQRRVRVAGAGAFVALKALAFHIRGENKDAYDLFYLLRNFGRGVSDVAGPFRSLLPDPAALMALEHLRMDFLDAEALGPRRVAEFIYGRSDLDLQTDVVEFVRSFLEETSP
ncbi:MAG: hypothetical protein WCK27_29600 [Verrucomicrobiota bacterium]